MNSLDLFRLDGKTIVVTGASSGLGKQTVRSLALRGAKLLLVGREESTLNAVIEEISVRDNCEKILTDLTNPASTDEIISAIKKSGSTIAGFVHSAGVTATLPLRITSKDTIQQMTLLNVSSAVELAGKLANRQIVDASGGSFVFIASIMGLAGEIGKTAYSLTKGAIIAGVRSMALELAPKRIRVNCISPGVVTTPMVMNGVYAQDERSFERVKQLHPLGLGTPEDVANACVFLLSDASKWITGTNLVVDGGYTAK